MARTKQASLKPKPMGQPEPRGIRKPVPRMTARQMPLVKMPPKPNAARKLALQNIQVSNGGSDTDDDSDTGSSETGVSSEGGTSTSSDDEASSDDDEDEDNDSEEDVKPVIEAPAPANNTPIANPVRKQTPASNQASAPRQTSAQQQTQTATPKPTQVLRELNDKAYQYDVERGITQIEALLGEPPVWHKYLGEAGSGMLKQQHFWKFMKGNGLKWAPRYDQAGMEDVAAVFGQEAEKDRLPLITASPAQAQTKARAAVKELNKQWEAQRAAAGRSAALGIEEAVKKLSADLAEHELRARMAWAASDLKAEVDSGIAGMQARVEVAVSDFLSTKKKGC